MWLSATVLLVGMCLIMHHANGKAVRDWDLPINLNSLIATLSTVYRALLVAIAAEIISQEQWIWFWSASSPARPLTHLQMFNTGGRSIGGALKLLPVVLGRSVPAVFAIIVIVVSFAVGPFTQQALNTINRDTPIPGGIASLPVSRLLTGEGAQSILPLLWGLNFDARGILYSIATSPTSNDSVINALCESGNCTFPSWGPARGAGSKQVTHASIGVCNTCNGVSSLVEKRKLPQGGWRARLPKEDLELVYFTKGYDMRVDSLGNLSWAQPVISREVAQSLRWSLVNVTVFTMTDNPMLVKDQDPYPIAVTCSLYPCLQSYSASVRNGKLTESLVRSTPMYPDAGNYTGKDWNGYFDQVWSSNSYSLAAVQYPCRINDSIYTASNMSVAANATTVRIFDPADAPEYPAAKVPEECTYRLEDLFWSQIGEFLSSDVLNGTCVVNYRESLEADCGSTWWLARFWEDGLATVDTIKDTFSDIADALTNKIRLGLGRGPGTAEKVTGVALQTLPYTSIKWQWLALPASLLVIETVILAWMIGRSWMYRNEERVWKSNVLPLLYYGDRFTGVDGSRFERTDEVMNKGVTSGSLMTADEMDKDAKHVKVRFVRGLRQDDDN
ncbi:hypothetical protein FDECE_13508 [Fusarium decemcellulare]|nr:hypothetical protein FDECE_13508 [Fusarium decemcellulare]